MLRHSMSLGSALLTTALNGPHAEGVTPRRVTCRSLAASKSTRPLALSMQGLRESPPARFSTSLRKAEIASLLPLSREVLGRA